MFRRATVAAAIVIAAIGGISLYRFSSAQATAATVERTFGDAISAIAEVPDYQAIVMVRTESHQPFYYISSKAKMVKHTITVAHREGRLLWRLDKEDSRHVSADGHAQYLWYGDNKAFIHDYENNIAEMFTPFFNISRLMEEEKLRAEQSPGDRYEMERKDSTLQLTIHSRPRFGANPLTGTISSLSQNENIRQYDFNAGTRRLSAVRYWIIIDGQRRLVMECNSIDYSIPTERLIAEITDIPHSSRRWIDLRDEAVSISPKRLALLHGEKPQQAAQRILTAIFTHDDTLATEALRTNNLTILAKQFKGYTSPHCKEIINSPADGYSGVYAVMEATTPSGEKTSLVLSLRKDNPYGVWTLDGGI